MINTALSFKYPEINPQANKEQGTVCPRWLARFCIVARFVKMDNKLSYKMDNKPLYKNGLRRISS